jgi:ABC-type phosphate transport system auxiliary subunit
MPEPIDVTPRILQQIQDGVSTLQAEVRRGFAEMEQRFERVDKRLDAMRQALNGESVLGRLMAGEVEERLAALEARISALEAR